jgi:PsbP
MARSTHLGRYLVPLGLITVLLGLLAPAFAVAADTTTYQDAKGAYSFTLPDGWQANPSGDSVMFVDNVNGTNVIVTPLPVAGLSLDDAFKQAAGLYTGDPTYQANPAGVSDLTIGGQPAKALTFRSIQADGSPALSTAAIAVINNGTAYVIYLLTTTDKEDASNAGLSTIFTSWKFS